MKTVLILSAFLLLVMVSATSRFAGVRPDSDELLASIPPLPTFSEPGSPVSAHQDEAGSDIKLVLLALLPEGFESNEMQLDPGEYLLIIGNRTGLKEVDVRLDREGTWRVASAVGGRQRDWKKRLKLTPGTYLVTANDNPDWTCRIEVRP